MWARYIGQLSSCPLRLENTPTKFHEDAQSVIINLLSLFSNLFIIPLTILQSAFISFSSRSIPSISQVTADRSLTQIVTSVIGLLEFGS